MDLSQFGLGGTNGTSPQTNIPGLEGIQNSLSGIQSMLPIITIGSLVITVLFLVLYIMHIVHRWKVDKAIIETQKDVHAVRVLLEGKQTPPETITPVSNEPRDVTPPTPASE